MKKPLYVLIALICVIAGCKIDEAGIPQAQSNSLLLGTWFVKSAITVDPVYGTSTQLGFTLQDFYTFNKDNTIKVSTSLPASVASSRYSYMSNASSQTINILDVGDSGFTTYTIDKLTTDSLIMTTNIVATAFGTITTTTVTPLTYKLARK
jgi:hypothetical protein